MIGQGILALALTIGLYCPLALATGEHAGCQHPFDPYPVDQPGQLRLIADECQDHAVADLFYYRAYHAELLDKFEQINRLKAFPPNDNLTYYHTQRIFIALAEAFAKRAMQRGAADAIAQLNRHYDRSIEIAELQLRGYEQRVAQSGDRPEHP